MLLPALSPAPAILWVIHPSPGYTSSNGPNWVDFTTVNYSKSLVLAYAGATVDAALVKQYLPTVLSLKQQIQNEFIPIYAPNTTAVWNPLATLFAIWIDINDVGNSYSATENGTPQSMISS
jgi:hypothetical protein